MRELTQSTVIAVLRKLLNDGLVEVVGQTHSGKVLSRTYRPTEKSREVILQYFLDEYSAFSNVISKADLCKEILIHDNGKNDTKSEFKKLKSNMSDIV